MDVHVTIKKIHQNTSFVAETDSVAKNCGSGR